MFLILAFFTGQPCCAGLVTLVLSRRAECGPSASKDPDGSRVSPKNMASLQTSGRVLEPIEVLSSAVNGRLEKAKRALKCRCCFAGTFQVTSERSLGKSPR